MAKLILTHDVTGLGEPGDVVDVKDGYARNYLVPRGLATGWSKGAEKDIASMRKARKSREIATVEGAASVRDSLQSKSISIVARAGASGRLFGAVTTGDLVAAVLAAGGPSLDKRKIEIDRPIKALGEYEVKVRLHADVAATLAVRVVPEA